MTSLATNQCYKLEIYGRLSFSENRQHRPSSVIRYRLLPLCTSDISHLANKIKTLLGCISYSEKFPFLLSAVS